MENTTALKNLPQAGSSAPENTLPTTFEKIMARTIKNPAITALVKYLPKPVFTSCDFAAAAFDTFCTSS